MLDCGSVTWTTPAGLLVMSNVCHWLEATVPLYWTVRFWPGNDVTSKLKALGVQVALVRVRGPIAAPVVKLPPVIPLSGWPETPRPFITVHWISRVAGKGAEGVQVSTELPMLQEVEEGRSAWDTPSTR